MAVHQGSDDTEIDEQPELEQDSDGSSSAPNSEAEYVSDDEEPDIELRHIEDKHYLEPIPVVVRLVPPVYDSPILEVWGARAFGYIGNRTVWGTYRAEPASDEVDDDANYWAPLGIRLSRNEFYRAWMVRQTPETLTTPPEAPEPLPIGYVHPDFRCQPVDGAVLIKTFRYQPSNPRSNIPGTRYSYGPFWLLGCGKVIDKKDLKRILNKTDLCEQGIF